MARFTTSVLRYRKELASIPDWFMQIDPDDSCPWKLLHVQEPTRKCVNDYYMQDRIGTTLTGTHTVSGRQDDEDPRRHEPPAARIRNRMLDIVRFVA